MLSTAELRENLRVYQAHYSTGQTARELLLPSKAALLDVCGWLEEAMDKVVTDCAARCNLSSARLKSIQDNYVKKTNGFDYDRHFERMLAAVVGHRVLEQVEAQMGATTLAPFRSALTSLVPLRNHYAHTHLDVANPYPCGVTAIPAPSALVSYVDQAETALQALETALHQMNC
jgi:hypothetical protein